jgi:hypothetical protein
VRRTRGSTLVCHSSASKAWASPRPTLPEPSRAAGAFPPSLRCRRLSRPVPYLATPSPLPPFSVPLSLARAQTKPDICRLLLFHEKTPPPVLSFPSLPTRRRPLISHATTAAKR